ncbi:hypothetical protein FH063_004248 [Azospirillum argentinense]|uniref:Uncharacterized protein n=1 Tax=Azospirillum argentinense TaxID=2970906 RepID=A0A5B0KKU9_9PROT|nr:hypothetical protein FH063_004248 [Azospirillum argentinense]
MDMQSVPEIKDNVRNATDYALTLIQEYRVRTHKEPFPKGIVVIHVWTTASVQEEK